MFVTVMLRQGGATGELQKDGRQLLLLASADFEPAQPIHLLYASWSLHDGIWSRNEWLYMATYGSVWLCV